MSELLRFATAALLLGSVQAALAVPLTHDANDPGVPPVALSPAFGALVDDVGTAYIHKGVDYTFGGVEGIFDDGDGVHAFCGISGGGDCNLLSPVDGRIVVAGTTDQGLTSFIHVEAGFADAGSLVLEVFDLGMTLLDSTLLGPPSGPNGRLTMTIDRLGVYDIAFFRVSGGDTFGVNLVMIEMPIVAAVSAPTALALMLPGMAGLRRRRLQTARS